MFSHNPSCSNCGVSTKFINYSGSDYRLLCNKCKMEENPPIIILESRGLSAYYWNILKGESEVYMSIDDFIKCGWFLRKKTIYESIKNKFRKVVYLLEYYGKLRCRRCKDYKYFPEDMTKCHNYLCDSLG